MSEVNVQAFAERVERLCDFLLDKIGNETGLNGSEAQIILQDIKDDAANLQMFGGRMTTKTLDGLAAYMSGSPQVPENKE